MTTAQYFVLPTLALLLVALAAAGPIGKRLTVMRLKAQRRRKLRELAGWHRG